MEYVSTRGASAPLHFSDVVMEGLARDGGLYLPATIPDLGGQLGTLRDLSFGELAFAIMRPFVDLPDDDLRRLIRLSYATFRDPAVTPLVAVGNVHVLELFHGPTLAFKDVALQFLGNLFSHILTRTGQSLNIVAATSGDTGSAAIHGVRGKSGIQIFVMHPKGRTSKLQELQMTTVLDANVHNIAVHGTFDDCQDLVKTLFRDLAFRDANHLGAVNSINWARVLAQITYFAYASLQLSNTACTRKVRFAVPTGNFGDVFAGYMAARMGFPISKLVVATNENDILARFFETGTYAATDVKPTISPSMDIQVASNFERYLYYCLEGDGSRVAELLRGFAQTRSFSLPSTVPPGEAALLCAGAANTQTTLAAIRHVYRETGYLLDPHTAVGYHVSQSWMEAGEPMVCLATAHPAKFPDAIRAALGGDVARHPILDALVDLPARSVDMAVDATALRQLVASSELIENQDDR
jgi:threonine synthase